MFKLENEIRQWRQAMQTAGLGPEAVAELESHVRDALDTAVRQGVSEPEAFTAAVARLGAPRALKHEFEVAIPRVRLRAIMRRNVSLFPTDLKLCAWAATLFGPYVMFAAVDTFRVNRVIVDYHLATGDYLTPFLLGMVLAFLVGLMGLTAAIGYLRRRTYVAARQLAAFWVFAFWTIISGLMLIVTQPIPGPVRLPAWMNITTTLAAIVAYWDWKRSLKKQGLSRNDAVEPRCST